MNSFVCGVLHANGSAKVRPSRRLGICRASNIRSRSRKSVIHCSRSAVRSSSTLRATMQIFQAMVSTHCASAMMVGQSLYQTPVIARRKNWSSNTSDQATITRRPRLYINARTMRNVPNASLIVFVVPRLS